MTEVLAAGGGIGVTAYGIKLLNDVAGPSAKMFGTVLSEWVGYRMRNFLSIGKVATDIIGDDPEPGEIHPRVVHRILEEATWLDDDVMQNYAGGMLAASRTPDGREERGAYYVNLLAAMTGNQIRLHHAMCTLFVQAIPSGDCGSSETLIENTVIVPAACAHFLDNPDGEPQTDVVGEAILALAREGLVGAFSVNDSTGICSVVLSQLSLLLYLWAYGIRTSDVNAWRTASADFGSAGSCFTEGELGPFPD